MIRLISICCLSFCLVHGLMGQSLPDITLADIQGNPHQVSRLAKAERPTIVIFWAAWVPASIEAVEALAQQEWDATILAISIDRHRAQAQVSEVAKTHNWSFDVLMDEELALKRKLNVVNVPHVFLFDAKGELAYQQTALSPQHLPALHEIMQKLQLSE